MDYQIHTEQKFTDVGMMGVAFFVGGPIAAGLCYGWLLYQLSQPPFLQNIAAPLVILGLSGIVFLFGCAMMLVGRSQTYTVKRVTPSDTDKQLWS